MRVRIKNGASRWVDVNSYIEPLICDRPVLIAIDQSKTNTAVIVGTLDNTIIDIMEFSGNDPEFYDKAGDTTVFCRELSYYLEYRLSKLRIVNFYQEAPIGPKKWHKNTEDKSGYSHYKSQMVLTQIRGCLLELGLKMTGRPSIEVVNTDWKGRILPDGYRGRDEKGSHRYLREINMTWWSYTDDVTDAVCIYMYALWHERNKGLIICSDIEKPLYKYQCYMTDRIFVPDKARAFRAEKGLSCDSIASYYTNRTSDVGAVKLDLNTLTLEDISKYAKFMTTHSEPYLVIKRE